MRILIWRRAVRSGQETIYESETERALCVRKIDSEIQTVSYRGLIGAAEWSERLYFPARIKIWPFEQNIR